LFAAEQEFGMMRRIAALACLALLVAAPAVAEDHAASLTIKDHRFQPEELVVPAGVKIKLTVKNLDPTPEEFESVSLRREKVIPGGTEGVVYIGPLKPGSYDFFGDFNPKTARGQIVAK
jgi:hypothetical protein